MATLTQAELERHLWQAADILRGTVDAGDYKQYIFGLLFYRRLCDVWDEEFEALFAETGNREEAADPDEHRFHIPPQHHWTAIRKHSTQIGQHLNNAFAAIEDANLRLRGVFGDVDFANQERFPDARLEMLLAHFEKHRLRNTDVPPDMLGDAYMYLIAQFAEGSGKKGGEFYTPSQVVKLIVECLDPKPGMSIYDPTCGSGGMLLAAVQHIKEQGGDPRSLALYGQEKNLGTWAIAQINLFLHNIDDAFIAKGDTILDPKRYDPKAQEFTPGVGAYDRVMANPPFSEKVWGYELWSNGDPFGRDVYGCPPKGYGDLAFVQHMVASLKDDGLLGVVVPHGVLFRGGAEGRIREAMLKADIVEAVIGLVSNLFYGASIPAAILIIRKTKPSKRKGKMLIVNGDATFSPGKAQNHLSDVNVRALADAFHGFTDIDKLARVVSLEEIASNGFNLNISRYVETGADTEAVDVSAEVAGLKDMIAIRNEAEAVLFAHLKRLGYPPSAKHPHSATAEHGKGEWPEVRLSDLVSDPITYGVVQPGEYLDEGVLLVRGGDFPNGQINVEGLPRISPAIVQPYNRSTLRGGEILISLVGYPGACAIVPEALSGANISRSTALVRLGKEIDGEFLYHFIRSPVGQRRILVNSIGSAQQVVNLKDLREILVPVPPLAQQKDIASVMNASMGQIFLATEQLDRLKKLNTSVASDVFSSYVRVEV